MILSRPFIALDPTKNRRPLISVRLLSSLSSFTMSSSAGAPPSAAAAAAGITGGKAQRRGSGGGKNVHSRSYPRGVQSDFRKLAGLTLLNYIDHHGASVCVCWQAALLLLFSFIH